MSRPTVAAPEIEIAGRKIGAGHEPFVICELSGASRGPETDGPLAWHMVSR